MTALFLYKGHKNQTFLGPAWKSGRVVQGFRACVLVHFEKQKKKRARWPAQKPREKKNDWSGIRTHASEETSALNWRLRPLGHPTVQMVILFRGFCGK